MFFCQTFIRMKKTCHCAVFLLNSNSAFIFYTTVLSSILIKTGKYRIQLGRRKLNRISIISFRKI